MSGAGDLSFSGQTYTIVFSPPLSKSKELLNSTRIKKKRIIITVVHAGIRYSNEIYDVRATTKIITEREIVNRTIPKTNRPQKTHLPTQRKCLQILDAKIPPIIWSAEKTPISSQRTELSCKAPGTLQALAVEVVLFIMS